MLTRCANKGCSLLGASTSRSHTWLTRAVEYDKNEGYPSDEYSHLYTIGYYCIEVHCALAIPAGDVPAIPGDDTPASSGDDAPAILDNDTPAIPGEDAPATPGTELSIDCCRASIQ